MVQFRPTGLAGSCLVLTTALFFNCLCNFLCNWASRRLVDCTSTFTQTVPSLSGLSLTLMKRGTNEGKRLQSYQLNFDYFHQLC